jgi:hypothetical protein
MFSFFGMDMNEMFANDNHVIEGLTYCNFTYSHSTTLFSHTFATLDLLDKVERSIMGTLPRGRRKR